MGLKFIKYRYIEHIKNWNDNPAIIASYLRQRINKEDYIYVADYNPILYYLVPARTPTKYAFPQFLTNKEFSHYSGSNPIQELNLIMKKHPVYIIKQDQKNPDPDIIWLANDGDNNLFKAELDSYIQRYYTLETSIKGVEIYKRSQESGVRSQERR
jgi:hypothetical protein